MAVYDYDPKTNAISKGDYIKLMNLGFLDEQIKKTKQKLKYLITPKPVISHDEQCITCGSNEMIRTGVCFTCNICGTSNSCG